MSGAAQSSAERLRGVGLRRVVRTQQAARELPGLCERVSRLRQERPEDLEDVHVGAVELEPRVDPLLPCALDERLGLWPGAVALAGLDEEWRQAREAGAQRTDEGIADRMARQIRLCRTVDVAH